MGKKADIVISFGIVSGDRVSITHVEEVLKILPKPETSYIMGQQRILTNGKTIVNNETTINFRSNLKAFDIEDCNKIFFEYWQPYSANLKTITNIHGYKLLLNYEVTVCDLHYPSFMFHTEFLSFVSGLGIEFSMEFYND